MCDYDDADMTRIVYAFNAHGSKIRVMDGDKKLREQSAWSRTPYSVVLVEMQTLSACVLLAEEYSVPPDSDNAINQEQSILDEPPILA